MIQVVLVEKDPSLAWLYREELEEAGFGVCVHSKMDSALKELNGQPGRVLVTDLTSVGTPPEAWLPGVRAVYDGPVVLLAPGPVKSAAKADLPVVPKSSDITPLIKSLRGQMGKLMWSQAAAGVC